MVTLQSVSQQRVQLRVELGFLLQHVKEQLVLCGAGDLRLLQPALHHLHLRLLLGRLQTLKRSDRRVCYTVFVFTHRYQLLTLIIIMTHITYETLLFYCNYINMITFI